MTTTEGLTDTKAVGHTDRSHKKVECGMLYIMRRDGARGYRMHAVL